MPSTWLMPTPRSCTDGLPPLLCDVPHLLAYTSRRAPVAGGATKLTYVVVWSHEDAGTGFLPFLEWGTWGRMTDIENAISFTVEPNGTVSGAQYLSGGRPSVGFPDSQTALKEVDAAFSVLGPGPPSGAAGRHGQ